MRRPLLLALALCLVPAVPALLGCGHRHAVVGVRSSGHHHGHGPPPHAPAHGYRAKHHASGAELVFDSELGVYVVVGLERHYYSDDLYYRLHGGSWQVSVDLDGPWKTASRKALPPGLRKRHARGGPGQGKGGPPASHSGR